MDDTAIQGEPRAADVHELEGIRGDKSVDKTLCRLVGHPGTPITVSDKDYYRGRGTAGRTDL